MVLTLYYHPTSPPSRTVLLTARAAGVKLTLKEVDFTAKEQFKSEFLKLNPQHTVPVLTDDNLVICESHAISGYLIHQYAPNDSLYPKDPKKRALVDQRLHFDTGILFPKIRGICLPVLLEGKKDIDDGQKAGVHEALSFLDEFLEGKPWVSGNEMTIADFACVASVSSFVSLGFDLSKYKNLKGWLSRCQSEIPGYAELNEPGATKLGEVICSHLLMK